MWKATDKGEPAAAVRQPLLSSLPKPTPPSAAAAAAAMAPAKVVDDGGLLGSEPVNLRKLFVPVRVRGSQQQAGSRKPRGGRGAGSSPVSKGDEDPTPAVMSELLVSSPANPGAGGGGGGEWDLEGTNVLVVTGNPGVVMFYAEYLASLRRALGSSVNAIVCLCHAGHTESAPRSPAPAVFSMQQQIEHKVEFLSHAREYLAAASESLSAAEAQGRWWEEEGPPHKTRGMGKGASLSPGERWIIIGHSIGAHISLEVQKCMRQVSSASEAAAAAAEMESGGGAGAGAAPPTFPVIGLFPFLALNLESSKQQRLNWITHMTLLCVLGSLLGHLCRLLLPRGLLRRLMQASLGKAWSPAAIATTIQYMMLFERTPLDWEWLQANSNSCTFVFGLTDHWGPLSLYHNIKARVPAMRVQRDEEGHPHNFCCTVAGSKSIALLSARLCKLAQTGFQESL